MGNTSRERSRWHVLTRVAQRCRGRVRAQALWVAALIVCAVGVATATQPLQTTRQNFFIPGSQPLEYADPLIDPSMCAACHGFYDESMEPYSRWNHSLMGQSARDPIFYAALAITEQDASYAGQLCMRCHAPMTWMRNLVKFDNDTESPGYGTTLPLSAANRVGVACHICHRMVDPIYQPGVSPPVDQTVLAGLTTGVPPSAHNASMVLDPQDRRRGPFNLDIEWSTITPPGFQYHAFLQSPFHLSSRLCATCHDVSTPHFTRQTDGTYAINAIDQTPAPSKLDQFPEQRTYSEWSESLFAQGPVNLNGRFGGLSPSYASCQDCHMPGISGQGCSLEPPTRPTAAQPIPLPQHNFNGSNTWVLKAVRSLYPDDETELNEQYTNESIARNVAMLQAASDLEVAQSHGAINVRIINFSGHKLPTGYNEGRRMWINAKFFDAGNNVIAERGAYDPTTAVLDAASTKVYEAKMGPDAPVAALVGTIPGPGFRLAISNKYYKDNRIPPMGFTNSGFTAVQAGHVPANTYADGQYWDDTRFAIPLGARSVRVSVLYQTTSKEYVEFLRDANTSNTRGQTAYDQWVLHGKSVPAEMDSATLPLRCRCDWNNSGALEVQDIFDFLNSWFAGDGDVNSDGTLNVQDIFDFLNCWLAGCNGW
ncbi:MAG TPA: hypothetical protein PKE29_01655 [Phycisphaerales bacterium]|nr:hypothetical protein [Phycisphaerales bacterium]